MGLEGTELRIADSLEVTPFVPPDPKVRKTFPRNQARAVTQSRMENGKHLDVTRAAPSLLPDLKSIRAEIARKELAAKSQVAPHFDLPEPRHRFLNLGATVIDRSVSHVTWIDEESGEILLPPSENSEESETLADLRLLGDLIARERKRLTSYQNAREARWKAERIWREQNPEPPRDETVWIRPHSGSRYLQEKQEIHNNSTPTKGAGK